MREALDATFESMRNSGDGEAVRLEQMIRQTVEDAPDLEQEPTCDSMVDNLIEWLFFVKRRGAAAPQSNLATQLREMSDRFRVSAKTARQSGFRVYEGIFSAHAAELRDFARKLDEMALFAQQACNCAARGWGGAHGHAYDCPVEILESAGDPDVRRRANLAYNTALMGGLGADEAERQMRGVLSASGLREDEARD